MVSSEKSPTYRIIIALQASAEYLKTRIQEEKDPSIVEDLKNNLKEVESKIEIAKKEAPEFENFITENQKKILNRYQKRINDANSNPDYRDYIHGLMEPFKHLDFIKSVELMVGENANEDTIFFWNFQPDGNISKIPITIFSEQGQIILGLLKQIKELKNAT